MNKINCLFLLAASAMVPLTFPGGGFAEKQDPPSMQCEPTQTSMLGPFYKPDAPLRNEVGEGYILSGKVKSASDCSPIPEAEIELWQAGPDGEYDDAHRATIVSDEEGRYRFETDFPGTYGSRPPHIHIRVSAEGYETLVTQHYPKQEKAKGASDLVLIPEKDS